MNVSFVLCYVASSYHYTYISQLPKELFGIQNETYDLHEYDSEVGENSVHKFVCSSIERYAMVITF